LQHYARRGAWGENGADARSAMFAGEGFPFDHVYFVELGDDLDYAAYSRQLDGLADYLYADLASPLGAVLDACREAARRSDADDQVDLRLKSLRMAHYDADDDVAPMAAVWDRLACQVPPAIAAGCGRTSLLLTPPEWSAGDLAELVRETTCTAVRGIDSNAYLCEEFQDISLAQIVARLAESDPQSLEALSQLHSRIDIAWSKPAIVCLGSSK
jgi:hypothetical protein